MGEIIQAEVIEKHIKAGKIARQAQEKALELLKPGVKLLDLAVEIEGFIVKKDAFPGWPVNLSLNNDAAHDTPKWGDERVLGKEDLIKIDIGVSVEGYLADSAMSWSASKQWQPLIKASENALKAGLENVKSGMNVGDLGKIIEQEIKKSGFNVVENLTGHGLERYNQHGRPSIPNVGRSYAGKIEEGNAYALEPFVCNGKGWVSEGSGAEIFQEDEPRNVRNPNARKIMEFIQKKYHGLPFAERWIEQELKMGEFARKIGLRELMVNKCIRGYPVLREEKGIMVAQSENSFIINGGETIILVK